MLLTGIVIVGSFMKQERSVITSSAWVTQRLNVLLDQLCEVGRVGLRAKYRDYKPAPFHFTFTFSVPRPSMLQYPVFLWGRTQDTSTNCLDHARPCTRSIHASYQFYLPPPPCTCYRLHSGYAASLKHRERGTEIAMTGAHPAEAAVSATSRAFSYFSWMGKLTPGFALHGSNIKVLQEPDQFYQALKVSFQ